MDPNANLKEQREVCDFIMHVWDNASDDGSFTPDQEKDLVHAAYRLAELVQALDQWITGRGFLPVAWSRR